MRRIVCQPILTVTFTDATLYQELAGKNPVSCLIIFNSVIKYYDLETILYYFENRN